MSLTEIRALTFDTGGTILDWHTGFATVMAETGAKHGIERNWHDIANDLRRKGLGKMLNLGRDAPPTHNFDDAHRMALDELIAEHGLQAFTEAERHTIAYDAPPNFDCWPDFPAVLPKPVPSITRSVPGTTGDGVTWWMAGVTTRLRVSAGLVLLVAGVCASRTLRRL